MRLAAVAAAAAAALTGCVDRLPVDAAGRRTALPAVAPPAAAAPTPSVQPSSPPAPADTCGAAELAYMAGKPRSELPIPVDLTRRRVVCESCPVDPDLRPERQTVVFDAATGRVLRTTCG